MVFGLWFAQRLWDSVTKQKLFFEDDAIPTESVLV
jgi:hypothetical protein